MTYALSTTTCLRRLYPVAALAICTEVVAAQSSRSVFDGKDLAGWHVDVPAMDSSARVRNPFILRNGMLVTLG